MSETFSVVFLRLLPAAFIMFFQLLTSLVFFLKTTKKQQRIKAVFPLITLASLCSAAVNYFMSDVIFLDILIFFAANIVISTLVFGISFSEAAFYSIFLAQFLIVSEIIVIATFFAVSDIELFKYSGSAIFECFIKSIANILFMTVCFFVMKLMPKRTVKKRFSIFYYIFPIITTTMLILLWYTVTNRIFSGRICAVVAAMGVAMFGAAVIQFLSVERSTEKETELLRMKNEFSKMQTELTYYKILESKNNELAHYVHDTKHHLSAIQGLNHDPDVAEYIEKVLKIVSVYGKSRQSGNHMLDVILNKYITEAELKSIDFFYDVRIDNLSFVERDDLVTILGNLIDNAFEAAEKSQEKKVSFITERRNNYTVLIILNSCDAPPRSSGDDLYSTKSIGGIHGVGLKSVAKTLKKYSGDFIWEYEGEKKSFKLTAMLMRCSQE